MALELGRRTLSEISETPNLDTQLLLCHLLERQRAWLLAHLDADLDISTGGRFLEMLARCEAGEPLAYVLGWKEFFGRRFQLDARVLIPRPETELMIEKAIDFMGSQREGLLVADVGTGSGCVAVTLAAEMPGLRVVATDLSLAALRVAQINADEHGVADGVRLIQTDLLAPFPKLFDVICANLPYIPAYKIPYLRVAEREPHIALNGGQDGLEFVRRLIITLPDWLKQGGRAYIEIDQDQAEAVLETSQRTLPQAQISVIKDMAGLDRLLVIDRV